MDGTESGDDKTESGDDEDRVDGETLHGMRLRLN